MSIFENANRKVEKHNYGMNSKFDRFGRRIIDLPEKQEPVTEDITAKIIQGPDTIKPELSPGEKAYRETRVQNAINFNTKSNIMRNMHSEILNGVLENVIGSIYYDALYLDDDFKEYNSVAITESVHDFLNERGGYRYIQEAYNRTKSPLLKSIMDICEETARDVSERKVKECNEKSNDKQSLDDIKIFDMNDEEKEKLDYDKDSIGIDKISGVIKDKILNVVKEEKKREAEHVELIEEIENQLSEDEQVNDEKAVAEALSSIFIQNTNIEEGTLFNSMLRKNYKNVIESGYDSLTLSKLDRQSELDELLNGTTLDDIVTENEIVDPDGQLITTEVKDIFNDFMDELEKQKDIGNTDSEALLEAFAQCENKFYEVAESKISKTELKAIRRDLKILQETFNEFLPVEEGVKDAVSKGVTKIDDAITKADTKLAGKGYELGMKAIKDPEKLRKILEIDKNTVKVCKQELAKRDKADSSKLSRMIKDLSNSFYYATYKGHIENNMMDGKKDSGERVPSARLKQMLSYYEEYVRIVEKRIAELEADKKGKGKKSVKESYDLEYDLWFNEFDSVEEAANKEDETAMDSKVNSVYEKAVQKIDSVSEIQQMIKQNDEMYKKFKDEAERRENDDALTKFLKTIKNSAILAIPGTGPLLQHYPQHSPNFILRRHMKNNRICDKLLKKRLAELKKGKKSVKENYEYFDVDFDTVEEKNVITNNKFVDAIKDKFTPPGSGKKKSDKEKDKEKNKDEKTKATKEGVDCDSAGGCATKEGVNCGDCDGKKVKKIDTTFDMNEKVKENSYEYFDIDDEFDITEEAISKDAAKFTARNIGTIMSNMIKRKKDINSIHDNLLKMVNRCKTVGEVEYLQKDISSAKALMRKKAEKAKTSAERKSYQTHIAWLGSEYSKALSAKKKELKNKQSTKNKAVKEACSDILDECMTIIDKKLDLHEASDLNMANEVRSNYHGTVYLMPLINKKDVQLEGLDLAYKMKHVIESLVNILENDTQDNKIRIVTEALVTNKNNTNAILESFRGIPSTPVYKINYFKEFNELLDIITENVTDIANDNNTIEINEYDDSFLDFYESDHEFRVITESVNDFSINDSDEFIDMDFVLADTIAQYTLLETMYTLQLENPKYNDIKKITNKLLNR